MRKLIAMTATLAFLAIPATAGATKKDKDGKDDHKVGICHKTSSATNPYEFIEVDEHAVEAHLTHHGDVISTDGTCPTPPPAPEPVPCPPPTEVQVPVIVTVPGTTETTPVTTSAPVTSVAVPGATSTKVVVVTPKRKRMKCERRFNKKGVLVIVCRPTPGQKARKTARKTGEASSPGTLTG